MGGRSQTWLAAPEAYEIKSNEVHVWRFPLDTDESAFAPLLDETECERARRFRFAVHAKRFVVRHGRLRLLLGAYLGRSPASIRFTYGPQGKPELADPESDDVLRFNLSHSDGLVLLALSRGRRLGVDIERLRPEMIDEKIPEQFFSPCEVAVLRALPEADQVVAFFNCWTRKEAYIKAIGLGLSLPLDSFDVSLAPGAPVALLGTRPDKREAARWSMTALLPGDGFAGALAVEGGDWRLSCWQTSE